MEYLIDGRVKSVKTDKEYTIVDIVFTDDLNISMILNSDDNVTEWIREDYKTIKEEWLPLY